jgi:hypothetical protein
MIPVKQTTFGDGKEGRPHGNCLSACIASMLEISIEDVPIFVKSDTWFEDMFKWLQDRGYEFKGTLYGTDILNYDVGIGGYYIVNGLSPRNGKELSVGTPHAVLFKDRKMDFDPHPSDSGLLSIENAFMIEPI